MRAPSADDWQKCSRECLEAARLLVRSGKSRSAASRAYFSAYASTHAILLRRGLQPPERGNWPHEGLPTALAATLGRGGSQPDRTQSLLLKQSLAACWMTRIIADYGPTGTLDDKAARDVVREATRLYKRMENEQ